MLPRKDWNRVVSFRVRLGLGLVLVLVLGLGLGVVVRVRVSVNSNPNPNLTLKPGAHYPERPSPILSLRDNPCPD